jgi:predicted nuclease with TOPRIM domain
VTAALAITALLGVVAVVLQRLELKDARLDAQLQRRRGDDLKAHLDEATERLELSERQRHADLARREAVILTLKAEIHRAEEALSACVDPAVVGERLRRLLLQGPGGGA